MGNRTTLSISLTPELSMFIDQKVASGLYTSSSEVIREALRLFKDYERDRSDAVSELKEKIAVGLAQAQAGQLLDGEAVFDELEKDL